MIHMGQSDHNLLMEKIKDGRTDLVFDYIHLGGRASATDAHGVSLIQWCAYHGDVSAIKFLVSQGESLTSMGANLDLNGAVFHGHRQLVEYLLESGADVNYPLPDTGETPLHSALCKTDADKYDPIVMILLKYHANPHAVTKHDVETGSFMRDCRTKGETPLHRAAAFGSDGTVQMLLEAGARKEAKDMHGDTPLSWASWYLRPRAILKKLCYGRFNVRD